MSLGQWSTTAANNATADPSINWQEGQAPSTVNDSARAMMAAIATWFQAPEWINPALTPTYVSANSFTLAGNQTALYAVGRRVRTFNTGGTVYGTISASAYTTLTTVTITPDSGALDSGLSEADVGIVTPGKSLMPGLVNVQVFTASGTYTPSPGATKAIIEAIGAGGAGGGVPSTAGSLWAVGGGGSAGSYLKAYAPSISAISGASITIGAGGIGAVGAAGGNGGQTTVGTAITCPGGNGGALATAQGGSVTPNVGLPGATSSAPSTTLTPLISLTGEPGDIGMLIVPLNALLGGKGGNSPLGSGGQGNVNNAAASANGSTASGKGCGGGGAASQGTSTTYKGGDGSAGLVLVFELA